MNQRSLKIEDLGRCEYSSVYKLQKETVERKRSVEVTPDYLFFVEHPDVYTFGRKWKDLGALVPENSFFIERGGEATYHNPGQLVIYPILQLEGDDQDIQKYLRSLEQIVIRVLGRFGVIGSTVRGATGVWVDSGRKKVASIGVALSGWVTYHGVAINIENDLKGFQRISPCGFSSDVMTSMKDCLQGISPGMDLVKAAFVNEFLSTFAKENACFGWQEVC